MEQPESPISELDTLHHQGLHIALDFTTSPRESLYIKANELSLSLRRRKLALSTILNSFHDPKILTITAS